MRIIIKPIFFSLLISLFFCSNQTLTDTHSKASLYFFRNFLFDADSLKKNEIKPAHFNFSESEKYVFAYEDSLFNATIFSKETVKIKTGIYYAKYGVFKVDSDWVLPFKKDFFENEKQTVFNGKLFTAIPNSHDVKIVDLKTQEESIIITKKAAGDLSPDGLWHYNKLFSIDDGVIYIKKFSKDFLILKFNEKGEQIFSKQIEHTRVEIKGNEYYYQPFLEYLEKKGNYIVFSSFKSDKKNKVSRIINLKNGKMISADYCASGIVLNDNNELTSIVKISSSNDSISILLPNSKTSLWIHTEQPGMLNDKSETMMFGDTLLLVNYSPIAMLADIYAFNYASGKILWKAQTPALVAGHSQYYNRVILTKAGNRAIIHGIEAGGSYLVVYNMSTGQKEFQE